MRIALLGAFDRNNLGDVLMPILLRERIQTNISNEQISFEYYGLSESNMESIKGVNTKPLYKLYEDNEKYDAIIIVGGEVLTSKYTNMYLNLCTNKIKILYYKLLIKLSKEYAEQKCKKKLLGKEIYPWILDKNKLNCRCLIYNTVGGKSTEYDSNIQDVIKRIDYISVREIETYKHISKINKNTYLYPDSVSCIANIWTPEELKKRVSNSFTKQISDIGDYYVLQVKNYIGKKIKNEIIQQIAEFYKRYHLKCVLMPIGYAQGHEDQIILKKIYKKTKHCSIFMGDNNIYQSVYILSKCKAYIGTSLHGAIISASYGIPHMALTNKIPKLIDYLETWKTTPIIYTDENHICTNLNRLIKSNQTDYMKKIIKQSDENITNIIEIIKKSA